MEETPVSSEERVITGADFTMHICLDHFNERLKIDDYRGNPQSIHKQIGRLLEDYPFTKALIKSRQKDWHYFLSVGYQFEACYHRYFNGSDAYSMAMFKENSRRTSDYWMFEDETL